MNILCNPITVIVEDNPLNISVQEPCEVNVIVSSLGIQGPVGPIGPSSSGEISQVFSTNILSGNNSYYISFPDNFSSIPIVNISLEVNSNYTYDIAASNVTISGFNAIFSDIVAETGVILNTSASINN